MSEYILIVDYGHGTRKYTAGKRSPDETFFEGESNREIGRRFVAAMCELGVDTREVVTEDEDISLQKRCDRVNKIVKDNPKKKCIFVSIHSNAGPKMEWDDRFSGVEVYVSRTSSAESVKMAKCYYETAKEFGLKGTRKVPEEGVWRANFKVLVGTNCPAMLTENLFMTNRKECEFLKSEEGKEKIVNLHIVSLCKYMGIPYAVCQG